VLLVGAGKVAEGRVLQLLEVEAQVHLIAPQVTPTLRTLAAAGKLTLEERAYTPGDCAGAFLVFAASDDLETNRAVTAEARERGILTNAADMPELCDFYVPSIGRQGPIVVAVSTAGLAPGLARVLRQRALSVIRPEDGELARLIGRLRRIVPAGPERTRALESLISDGAAELLRHRRIAPLSALVRRLFPANEAAQRAAEETAAASAERPASSAPVPGARPEAPTASSASTLASAIAALPGPTGSTSSACARAESSMWITAPNEDAR
jgi:precorrin-2 dehydrogenase/sirohydrochlorin ferrochelatase